MMIPQDNCTHDPNEDEMPLATSEKRNAIARRGDVLLRDAGEWSVAVHALLRHLERVGFTGAPRVVSTGFDDRGRETLTYIAGEVINPQPWADDAISALGGLLRGLHDATASFAVPTDAVWRHWFPRDLGGPRRIIGHGDTAPWNVVSRGGLPVALIDWEFAGPIDPQVELAQACWLNARLFDDVVAAREGLAAPDARARQVRLLLDGYGLARAERAGFVDQMVAYAIHDAADQVYEGSAAWEQREAVRVWGITWRTRSAAWMLRHRHTLERALT